MMLKPILHSADGFIKSESGVETAEYAIVLAVVMIVALAVYGSGWGQALKDKLMDAVSIDISGAGL